MEEIYSSINENLKSIEHNIDKEYDIYADFNDFKEILQKYELNQRLKIIMMLYVYNVKLEDLNIWTKEDFIKYVNETEDEDYLKLWKPIFELL